MDDMADEAIGHGEGSIEVAVDIGPPSSLWIRLDVHLPRSQFYRTAESEGTDAWIGLTVEEGEDLITALREAIDRIASCRGDDGEPGEHRPI